MNLEKTWKGTKAQLLSGTGKGHGGTIKSSGAAMEKVCLVGVFSAGLSLQLLRVDNSDCSLLWETELGCRLCLGGDFGGSLASICTL